MEIILWTCVEAQKLINNAVTNKSVSDQVKVELVEIYKEHAPKTCKFSIDAKAD